MSDYYALRAKQECWRTNFIISSPAYTIFDWLPLDFYSCENWPTIADYNQLPAPFFEIKNSNGIAIHFKEQQDLENGYEPTIYLTGEVPTRKENWHDFFNMLIWKTFPRVKKALNSKHYTAFSMRQSLIGRSSIENLLTLFDESGLIITSSEEALLQLIKNMSWKELFWTRRQELVQKLRFIIFGHSLHEKLLNPYIGMVGHALLLKVEPAIIFKPSLDYISHVNLLAEEWVMQLPHSATPRALYPIPFLGFHGMHPKTKCESFYEDHNYFRTTRHHPKRFGTQQEV